MFVVTKFSSRYGVNNFIRGVNSIFRQLVDSYLVNLIVYSGRNDRDAVRDLFILIVYFAIARVDQGIIRDDVI